MTRASDGLRGRPGGPTPPHSEPRFGNIAKHSLRRTGPDGPDFAAIREGEDFRRLRRRFRGFMFPMTVLVLAWYFTYVVLGAYAKDFMATPVLGSINMGLVLGVAQFVTTAVIVLLYGRYVRRRIDPLVDELREREGGAGR